MAVEGGFGGFGGGDSNQTGYMAVDPHQKGFRANGKHARAKKTPKNTIAEDEDPNDPNFFDPDGFGEEPETAKGDPDEDQAGYMAVDPHMKHFQGGSAVTRAKKGGAKRGKQAAGPDMDPNDPNFFEEEPETARGDPDEDQAGYMAVDPHMKHFQGGSAVTRANKGGATRGKQAADMDPNDPNFFMEDPTPSDWSPRITDRPAADDSDDSEDWDVDDSDDPDDWEEDEVFQSVTADVVISEAKDLKEELARLARLAENDFNFTTKKKEYQGNDTMWVAEQHELLFKQPWWRSDHSRKDANSEFDRTKRGCFCVRPSETETGTYACSISMGDSKMKHMLLLPSYAGKESTAEGKTVCRRTCPPLDFCQFDPKSHLHLMFFSFVLHFTAIMLTLLPSLPLCMSALLFYIIHCSSD